MVIGIRNSWLSRFLKQDKVNSLDRYLKMDLGIRRGLRKKLFIMRVVKPWHRLPREVVDAPSLETFKVRLDGALSNQIWLKTSVLAAGGLD